ncbi:hypothetical protein FHG87_023368 [Trinorchestia longiramus]|nr:hypothetical protein FHG87_023368 [Trinorchestia longiramus]
MLKTAATAGVACLVLPPRQLSSHLPTHQSGGSAELLCHQDACARDVIASDAPCMARCCRAPQARGSLIWCTQPRCCCPPGSVMVDSVMVDSVMVDSVMVDSVMVDSQERDREEERRRISEEARAKRVEKIEKALKENVPQIKNDLIAFRNCFKLLIPDVKDFFIPLPDDNPSLSDVSNLDVDVTSCNNPLPNQFTSAIRECSSSSADCGEGTTFGSDFTRSAGILKATTVKIDLAAIKHVQETQDNHTVIANLKELINTLSSVWLPKIKSLQQSILPYAEGNSGIIKQLVQIKNSVESAVESYTSLTIIPMNNKNTSSLKISDHRSCSEISDDSDDDNDFIEVTDTDPRVSSALHSEAELLGILNNSASSKLSSWVSDHGAGPSGSSKTSSASSKKESSSSKSTFLTPESFGGNWKPPTLHVNPLAGLNQVNVEITR